MTRSADHARGGRGRHNPPPRLEEWRATSRCTRATRSPPAWPGALTWFAPIQPWLAAMSLATLGGAVWWRARALQGCRAA